MIHSQLANLERSPESELGDMTRELIYFIYLLASSKDLSKVSLANFSNMGTSPTMALQHLLFPDSLPSQVTRPNPA